MTAASTQNSITVEGGRGPPLMWLPDICTHSMLICIPTPQVAAAPVAEATPARPAAVVSPKALRGARAGRAAGGRRGGGRGGALAGATPLAFDAQPPPAQLDATPPIAEAAEDYWDFSGGEPQEWQLAKFLTPPPRRPPSKRTRSASLGRYRDLSLHHYCWRRRCTTTHPYGFQPGEKKTARMLAQEVSGALGLRPWTTLVFFTLGTDRNGIVMDVVTRIFGPDEVLHVDEVVCCRVSAPVNEETPAIGAGSDAGVTGAARVHAVVPVYAVAVLDCGWIVPVCPPTVVDASDPVGGFAAKVAHSPAGRRYLASRASCTALYTTDAVGDPCIDLQQSNAATAGPRGIPITAPRGGAPPAGPPPGTVVLLTNMRPDTFVQYHGPPRPWLVGDDGRIDAVVLRLYFEGSLFVCDLRDCVTHQLYTGVLLIDVEPL